MGERVQEQESSEAVGPPAPAAQVAESALGLDARVLDLARRSDPGTRARILGRLQREHGNAAVARTVGRGRRRLQRFEAPVHEAVERQGLTSSAAGVLGGGLTNEEASAVYFGNWMRDLNQVFVPLVREILRDDSVIFSLISYMAAKKFGRVFTSEQFGYYIPAEHIDSPAGLTWEDDLLPGPPMPAGEPRVPGAQPRPQPYVTQQEHPEPSSTVLGAPILSVDQTGTIAYIRRTNLHVERRLELAARSGRNPEGMMHFGAALHAIEDVFAHSNWIEMAVNQTLRENAQLLPSLTGAARQVFTYSAEQEVRPGVRRPVLVTGSFTGADTKISLASEAIKFMAEPLPAPSTAQEARAEERFISTLLRAYDSQLRTNPAFRGSIENMLRSNGVPEFLIPAILALPLPQIYDVAHWVHMPEWVKNRLINPMKALMRQQLSERVLQPAARSMQAEGINAKVADTSLINFLREQQAASTRTTAQLSPAQREAMEQMGRLTGKSVDQQEAQAQASAGRHVAALQSTPERILAGPTHSQIAKDHPNSPFYGLAFRIATEAVRRMRERMLAAWQEQAGAPTTAFDFNTFPSTTGVPADQLETAQQNRSLYQDARTRRAEKETKSLERGNRVVAQGGDVHVVEGQPPGTFRPYDVAAMRRDSASQIRTAAEGVRATAAAPGQAGDVARRLQGLIALLDVRNRRLQAAQRALGQAAAAGQAASTGANAAQLRRLADELDRHAATVEAARTQPERQAANRALAATRDRVLVELRATPDAHRALAAAVLVVLDQQISDTATAYTTEQRDVLEGRTDLPEHTGAPTPLATTTINLPDSHRTIDPAWLGGQRGLAVRALIEESRILLNHPYENRWWVPFVTDYINRFPDQTLADIEARNAGYATFRRPGESREDSQ